MSDEKTTRPCKLGGLFLFLYYKWERINMFYSVKEDTVLIDVVLCIVVNKHGSTFTNIKYQLTFILISEFPF